MGINLSCILFRHHLAYRPHVFASCIGAQTIASIVDGWCTGCDTIGHHGMGRRHSINASRAMKSARRSGSRDLSSWRNGRTLSGNSPQNVRSFGARHHLSRHLIRLGAARRCANDPIRFLLRTLQIITIINLHLAIAPISQDNLNNE